MIKPAMLVQSAWKMYESGEEVGWRNAVSRAYYGNFHAALRACRDELGLDVPPKSHWRFIKFLREQADGRLRDLGRQLAALKRQRLMADYQLDADLSREDAKAHMRLAEQTMRLIAEIVKDHRSAGQPGDALGQHGGFLGGRIRPHPAGLAARGGRGHGRH